MDSSKLKKWLPAICMMLVIFIISSLHGTTVESVGLGKETYHVRGHFILFLMLMTFFYKAVGNVFLALLLTAIYAVLDEVHQYFVPGRTFQIFDIYIDILGALLIGVVLWKLQLFLPKKLKNWLKS